MTLVVFWSMGFAHSQAAGKHARFLHERYRAVGLRVTGVIEKTKGHEYAPEYVRTKRIEYPIYYDDFSALKKISSAAGIKRALPSIFLMDSKAHIRLYRRGFAFSSLYADTTRYGRPTERNVLENAPEGDRIEDYVVRLLKEMAGRRFGAPPAEE